MNNYRFRLATKVNGHCFGKQRLLPDMNVLRPGEREQTICIFIAPARDPQFTSLLRSHLFKCFFFMSMFCCCYCVVVEISPISSPFLFSFLFLLFFLFCFAFHLICLTCVDHKHVHNIYGVMPEFQATHKRK